MTLPIALGFAHNYEIELLDELPQPSDGEPILYYPGASSHGRDGLLIRVVPKEGKSWVGVFAFGAQTGEGFSGIFSCPEPNELCVVASWLGVIVRADDPKRYQALKIFPITDLRQSIDDGLLLFADNTTIAAWGRHGLAWWTQRLGWDGVEIQDVSSHRLTGRGWSPVISAHVPFEVNLADGTHTGGTRPEDYRGSRT